MPRFKISHEQVATIRRLLAEGLSSRVIAKHADTCRNTVYRVRDCDDGDIIYLVPKAVEAGEATGRPVRCTVCRFMVYGAIPCLACRLRSRPRV